MKRSAIITAIIIGAILLLFSLQWLGIANYSFFAPKQEKARREVFENTQSYVEGKRQAITKYYDEWRTASDEDKPAIREIVLSEFANFDTNNLLPQQQKWYNEITNLP